MSIFSCFHIYLLHYTLKPVDSDERDAGGRKELVGSGNQDKEIVSSEEILKAKVNNVQPLEGKSVWGALVSTRLLLVSSLRMRHFCQAPPCIAMAFASLRRETLRNWVTYITKLLWFFHVRVLEELHNPWILVGTQTWSASSLWQNQSKPKECSFPYWFCLLNTSSVVSSPSAKLILVSYLLYFLYFQSRAWRLWTLIYLIQFSTLSWCLLLSCNTDPVALGFICGCCVRYRAKANLLCWMVFLYFSYFMTLCFYICSSFP